MGYIWTNKLFVATVATLALLNSVHALPANDILQELKNSDVSVGKYKFSTYVSAFEKTDKSKESDMEEIHVCKGNEVVAKPKLNKDFVKELKTLGSGRNKNGTWYSIVKPASKEHSNGCYATVAFALGDSGEQHTVYTSASIKGLKLGTLVEIEELKGKKMNANQKHNGCVKVTGNHVDEGNLSLWVYSAAQQKTYFADIPSTVTVKQNTGCKLQDYYYSIDPNATIGKR
ncbi:hypothetical protein IWQ61_008258 [Dispira simplex]|nr:hypothetical protein IWQ61_008258 [Dispira simplex]